MKRTTLNSALIFAAALSLPMAADARLEKGTQEVGVQGNLDLDAQDDYQLNLNTSYGYLVRDNWEVGGKFDVSASESYKRFSLGLFTEYNFNNSTAWVPFIGAAANVGSASFNESGDDFDSDFEDVTALVIDLSVGVKYFVNDNVAISASFNHSISTDDIQFDGSEVKDNASNILFGTRFYF